MTSFTDTTRVSARERGREGEREEGKEGGWKGGREGGRVKRRDEYIQLLLVSPILH